MRRAISNKWLIITKALMSQNNLLYSRLLDSRLLFKSPSVIALMDDERYHYRVWGVDETDGLFY